MQRMDRHTHEPVIASDITSSTPQQYPVPQGFAYRPPVASSLPLHNASQPLNPLQQQQLQFRLQIQQQQQQLKEKILALQHPNHNYFPHQRQHQLYPPSSAVFTPSLHSYQSMDTNGISTDHGSGIDAPTPFFIETPIDDAAIGVVTPQIDTANMVMTPSLLDTVNSSSVGAPSLARPMPQITPIPEVTTTSLVQPSKNTIDNAGVLTLLKPARSKPKTKSAPKSKPAFVLKLWSMVNDASNQELISWCPDGLSLVISHRENFVQKILPKYFKHSNFASFVRQLNMYGWHKVQDPSSGSMHSDERWQFENPNFQRDHPELLDKIVRNKPQEDEDTNANGNAHINGLGQLDVSLLITELNTLKSNQLKITQELSRVRQDNDLLWQELYQTRERNLVQNEKVEKILQFLSSVYGNNKVPVLEDQQLDPNGQLQPYTPSDFTTTPNEQYTQGTYNKPRLMIKQNRHVSNSSGSTSNTTPLHPNGAYEIDNSPVQEIVRTPSNTVQPNYPQQYNNDKNDLDRAQEDELYQYNLQPQGTTSMAPPASTSQPNDLGNGFNTTAPAKVPFRPSLQSTPSLDDLTKTIEQQGQSLNDIINRLQQNQYDHDQPQTFDLDEFLNEEVQDTGNSSSVNTSGTGSTPRVSLQEVQDDDLKRGIDDDDVEEIINPSKKRKSGNF